MASFEIVGTAQNVHQLTSAKGNPYIMYQIKGDDGKIFELSLFGDGMSHAAKLKPNARVVVTGVLGSREYQDKNGKTRYGIEMKTQWIDVDRPVNLATTKAADVPQTPFDEIPF